MDFAYLSGAELFTIVQAVETAGAVVLLSPSAVDWLAGNRSTVVTVETPY
jgi:hypothetical protein